MVVLVELVGLGFFVKGFFPYKKSIPGFARPQDQPPDIGRIGTLDEAVPQYDRMVIMLVDALRNDFVFGNNSAMEYTQGLLREGQAVGFTAKALAPTVTMPRIKALMAGTVPNFLDAVLNIAESDTSSSLKYHDNLLWQLKHHRNKTINMFGDDTWLRLFPDIFTKTDGTSSFFVTDTVEVDNNVTRHVRPELERNDWDVTIFHYLGLDHIGHLAGPNSPLMKPKQKEMDDVVRDIYQMISRQDEERMKHSAGAKPTLFVLLGDHAMNEIGNHGGNSKLETSTVFVFMGQGIRGQPFADRGKNALSALLAREVPQINLVPTLALLFGVPVPKNNLGLPLHELLDGYSDIERLRMLQLTAHQIFGVVRANNPLVEDVDVNQAAHMTAPGCIDSDHELRCKYVAALWKHSKCATATTFSTKGLVDDAERAYYDFMEQANEDLSRAFSGYDVPAMAYGILIIGIATLALAALMQNRLRGNTGIINRKTNQLALSLPAAALMVTYILSNLSSSMIEEEHQFWYFWVQTMLVLRIATSASAGGALRTGIQMVLFRIVRAWNQTGQNWPGEIDIRFYLNSSHAAHMWALGIVAVVAFNMYMYWMHHTMRRRFCLPGIDEASKLVYRRLCACQWVFRAAFAYATFGALAYQIERNRGWETLGIPEWAWTHVRALLPTGLARMAHAVYACLLIIAISGTLVARLRSNCKQGIAGADAARQAAALDALFGMVPLLVLLSRPHNITLFVLFATIFVLFFPQLLPGGGCSGPTGNVPVWTDSRDYLHNLRPSKKIVQFCLLYASFFALGNSNSLASLDISNSYAGISRYSEASVGVLMFISNWAGPLWWGTAVLASMTLSNGKTQAEFRRELVDMVTVAHVWQACTLLALSVVVALMRTHLFIWSVFSPRYLYQVAWFVGYHVLFVTAGSLLWL
ncbi:major facilitator super transporter protein [Coemansia sp. RSA 1813]|nr:major facilitator super transporter protein [Coemansia sp. RSA 986]KAJ2211976.1 major facilitator super transporter protein [Coemansia sp. RSA 487]KAJ2565977.1 major facilitator super transporter protein [Coemansia sp. RSA 1813]